MNKIDEQLESLVEALRAGAVVDSKKPKVSPLQALQAMWRPVGEAAEAGLMENLRNEAASCDWLLTTKDGEGVFEAGICGALAAGGGTGKTAALCQLAVSVALGVDWLGFKVPTSGKVVLALGEESYKVVHRRLRTIICNLHRVRKQSQTGKQEQLEQDVKIIEERIIALPLAGISVSFVKVDRIANEINDSEFLGQFREQLKTTKDVRLIILDPLSRFAGLDTEKDNAAATRFVQAVESLAKESGAAVMVASHSSQASKKEGQADIRGVTGIQDAFRWAASMTKVEGGYIKLEQLKTNHSAWFKKIYLEMPTNDKMKVIPILTVADQEKAVQAQQKEQERKGKTKHSCGGSLYKGDRFCSSCGEKLGKADNKAHTKSRMVLPSEELEELARICGADADE